MVKNFIREFQAFALKGNLIDLAVAVVIGTAFAKVVDSIVRNVIMPIVSYVTPGMHFSEWHIGRIMIGYVLNDILSFLLVALAVFIVMVKVVGWLARLREDPSKAPPPPAPSREEVLLTEIRDLLRAKA